ncbi:hypothetical protein Anapl_10576 [Anas platyrhynchos]|uniref:Uncharacterized protein n=1 Tax=Anas platyrhynchos TaxID=8839 RepID=R0M4L0_ANAPL|nr:hypothetical protein Anapl_10576 [Anas platyrhynchos]
MHGERTPTCVWQEAMGPSDKNLSKTSDYLRPSFPSACPRAESLGEHLPPSCHPDSSSKWQRRHWFWNTPRSSQCQQEDYFSWTQGIPGMKAELQQPLFTEGPSHLTNKQSKYSLTGSLPALHPNTHQASPAMTDTTLMGVLVERITDSIAPLLLPFAVASITAPTSQGYKASLSG